MRKTAIVTLAIVAFAIASGVILRAPARADAYTYQLCGSKQANVAQGNSLYADQSTRRYTSWWFTQYIGAGGSYSIQLTIWEGSPLTVWKQFGATQENVSKYDDGGSNVLRAVSGKNTSGHGTQNMFVSYEANANGANACNTK